MKYTEGICGNGAAILKDGVMMTITEILNDLNNSESRSEQSEVEKLREQMNDLGLYISTLETRLTLANR